MSPPVIARIKLLLKALKYPKLDELNPEDQNSYRQAVVWLENLKVRDTISGASSVLPRSRRWCFMARRTIHRLAGSSTR